MKSQARLMILGVFVVGLLFLSGFSVSCQELREKIPSMIEVHVVDQDGNPYGFVTVAVLDENGRVVASSPVNDRGNALIKEGITAGTYHFTVKNVRGEELKVLEPDSVRVGIGKTVEVTIKVERIVPASSY